MSIHKLKAGFVEKVADDGLYTDGGNLYLKVRGTSKLWVFRYARSRFGGQGDAEMSLGPLHSLSLDDARKLAQRCRDQLRQHIDPLKARKEAWDKQQLEAGKNVSFEVCAEDYLRFMEKSRRWKDPDTRRAAKSMLVRHAYPKLKNVPIANIDHLQVAGLLTPISESTPVAADILRQHLKGIFDHAKANGQRTADNPADKRGALGQILPRLSDIHTVEFILACPIKKWLRSSPKCRTSRRSKRLPGWRASSSHSAS